MLVRPSSVLLVAKRIPVHGDAVPRAPKALKEYSNTWNGAARLPARLDTRQSFRRTRLDLPATARDRDYDSIDRVRLDSVPRCLHRDLPAHPSFPGTAASRSQSTRKMASACRYFTTLRCQTPMARQWWKGDHRDLTRFETAREGAPRDTEASSDRASHGLELAWSAASIFSSFEPCTIHFGAFPRTTVINCPFHGALRVSVGIESSSSAMTSADSALQAR
jgi:hypothetical protein